MLEGDVTDPSDQHYTVVCKRLYFIGQFLPFLRRRLAERLIVDTLAGAANLPNDVANLLLSEILVVGTPPQSAMTVLENIKTQPKGTPTSWHGYLIPSLDAAYIFVTFNDTQPVPLSIGRQSVPFPHAEDFFQNAPAILSDGRVTHSS